MWAQFRSLPARLLLTLGFLGVLIAGASAIVPLAAAEPYISVTVTFNNNGDLALNGVDWHLDHGCWTNDVEPPDSIPAHSTVSWEAESCGAGTGTEGNVRYRPQGAPDDQIARFYWDDPFVGGNSGSESVPTGCSVSRNGPGDGNHVYITWDFACSSTAGDGIPDVWKLHGASIDVGGGSKQFIDLPAMGATVNQKNIFVQLDWMANSSISQKLDPAALKKVVDAFASQNIKLIIDEGPDSILNYATNSTWGTLSKAKALTYQASLGTTSFDVSGKLKYDWTAFNAIRNGTGGFKSTGRAPIFHYAIAAHNIGTVTSSGISRTEGSDLIISLGSFSGGVGTVDQQTGTFMHELGHNLGLGHGGGDNVNNKPNYLSVMNYSFQMTGVIRNGAAGVFDYSHGAIGPLNENSLNEPSGLGSLAAGYGTTRYCPATPTASAGFVPVANANGPIDWDCDGSATNTSVSFDTNNDGSKTSLSGYDDWDNLKFKVGAIGSAGGVPDPPVETILEEMTPDMLNQIESLDTVAPVTTASPTPPANANGWNNTDVQVTLSATDDDSGVARTEYNIDNAGWTTYTAPVTLSAEGVHTFQYRSIDRAQNQEQDQSLTVRIDKTPPTVTSNVPAEGATYILHQPLTPDFSCDDGALSGVDTCTTSDTIDTDSVGSKTFTISASDKAGNTAEKTIHYTVSYDIKVYAGNNVPHYRPLPFPIIVGVTDYYGTDYASAKLAVYAVSLSSGELRPTSLNPNNKFNFGMHAYTYMLNPGMVAPGTYTMGFTVQGDPTVHTVQYVLR